MKTTFALITAAILSGILATSPVARAQGFTESDVVFYGEVRMSGGGQTVLLQGGHLRMTFVNQSNPANRVNLETDLRPTGSGAAKPYSYALKVPLAYLPAAPRIGEFLAISTLPTTFRIEQITIDGTPATLPDGSRDFYALSFASRAGQNRLDLLVAGDSTSTAHDGMPDWWKRLYGLDLNIDVSADDPDGDGWSNLEEFQHGSNPIVSNRTPQLVTAEIIVPEAGEAGLYLQFLDSDTPDAGLNLGLTNGAGSGFQLKVDGTPLAAGSPQTFTLTDLKSGRLTLAHTERTQRQFALPISWNDGGDMLSGEVLVRVVTPSAEDGSDAAFWLDGFDLPATGQRIATWPDRSGHGHPATQPLADYQPVVAAHSADFSGVASAHLFFQDAALPLGDHTVLVAYQAAAASDAPQTLLSTNRGYLQLAATTQALSYPGTPAYQMDDTAVRGYQNTSGTTSTSIFRRQANLLQNIFSLSYDGENTPVTAIDPVLPTLGARRSALPSGAAPVDAVLFGQLHELLVFPSALPEQKLRGVNDYLQSKWSGAVIWDFSTELKDLALTMTGTGTQHHIIRGGFGNDHLSGGPGDDTISGGGGDDTLTGGGGTNTFVFGGVDTGRDRITDFDQLHDIIDLSAFFWGLTGDARQFISVRLDANYATAVPTLDSVLSVQRPDGTRQEIVLQNTVIGSTQLIRLIVEGHLRMGALSIPGTVQLALAAGSSASPLREALDQSFTVNVTRSGVGVAAALDVPLGFFETALGGRFVVDGASNQGYRSVVNFARGETSKTLAVHPVPDLETAGLAAVQVAVLPHFRYAVGGSPVSQTISDNPLVWLEVMQANAVASPAQSARVMLHRNGSLAQSLVVDLQLGGTAVNGVHIQQVPGSVTILAGQSSREIQIAARAAGLTAGPKVLLLQLAARDRYLLGNPHEAVLYAGNTALETSGTGFDRWLQTSTHGAITNFANLVATAPAKVDDYLQAYALGLGSVNALGDHAITLQIVNGRPEISAPGTFQAADLRRGLQSSSTLHDWTDVGTTFTEVPGPGGLRFVGQPLDPGVASRFYRLSLTLDPGQLVGSGIAALTGATQYGISGNASWTTDHTTNSLVNAGGAVGATNRLIAKVTGPTMLDFEMEVVGGDAGDLLVFYVNGVRNAATAGESVRVQASLSTPGETLLMWEFTHGSGQAVIRKLAP
ncbi:MAG: type I secretion C-terminal target domain-containing protein [Verrucomicrobia bacterium]|nr:type I secretion C-terminal target domain-containing protein [Verrucomicrobiota bacterium]